MRIALTSQNRFDDCLPGHSPSDLRKKRCCICRQWFRPNPGVGTRQRMCGKAECRVLHRQKKPSPVAAPEPRLRHRLPDRSAAAQTEPPSHLSPDGVNYVFRAKLRNSQDRNVLRANIIWPGSPQHDWADLDLSVSVHWICARVNRWRCSRKRRLLRFPRRFWPGRRGQSDDFVVSFGPSFTLQLR
jgi:hypothetical protein